MILTRVLLRISLGLDRISGDSQKGPSTVEDEEREASFEEALADHAKVAKLTVDKWFVDKGFWFGAAFYGEVVFIHASVVQGAGARSRR